MEENKIRVLSFNVARNFLLVDSLLNICVNEYDIIFLQEPAWQVIRMAPSTVSREGDDVIGAPRHPMWTMMVRPPDPGVTPRVMAYVSTRLVAIVKGGVFGTMQDTCCPSYAYPACQTRQQ